jgi:hypothetical protein
MMPLILAFVGMVEKAYHGFGRRSCLPSLRRFRLGIKSSPVKCEECQRLTKAYMNVLTDVAFMKEAIATLVYPKLRAIQREEAKQMEAACEEALEELNRHREAHGC